jgi:hypothetical protein
MVQPFSPFTNARGHMILIHPGARWLGAGCTLNHPTVFTIGTVAPGAGFSRFILPVC